MRYIHSVQVSRRSNGNYWVHWTPDFTDGEVTVWASDNPAHLTTTAPVVVDAIDGIELSDCYDGRRMYFRLEAADGNRVIVAERILPLEGGVNFRDFGGYPAFNGRRVKWNRLYRSGYMSRLSQIDVNYLDNLGISVCCDFRNLNEQQHEPSLLPESTVIVSLPVNTGNLMSYFRTASEQHGGSENISKMMEELNQLLVEEYTGEYGAMFEQLLGLKKWCLYGELLSGKRSHRFWCGAYSNGPGRSS